MGKIIPFKIDRFDLGMTNNLRESFLLSPLVKNFDITQKRNALIPSNSTVSGDSDPATHKIVKMVPYEWNGSSVTPTIYGLGQTTDFVKIYRNEDFYVNGGTGVWTALANGESGSGLLSTQVFFEYHGLLFGLRAGTSIWKCDALGGAAFTEVDGSVTYTHACQGIVHSRDDIAYLGTYNGANGTAKISSKNDSAAWTISALTLPKYTKPVSLIEDGNYLGIGVRPASGIGKSTYFLWDRDSSLTTLSDKIDFGYGMLYALGKIDDIVFGVSVVGDTTTQKRKIIIRYWSGSGSEAQILAQFDFAITDQVPQVYNMIKVDKKLLFGVRATLNGQDCGGIWAISKNKNGTFSVYIDRLVDNNTAVGNTTEIDGILQYGDIFLSALHTDATYEITRTNDQLAFASTSTYETTVWDADDKRKTKEMRGITVETEPLPVNASYTLSYKVDADTGWTDIFTETNTGTPSNPSITRTATTLEGTGAILPKGKEIRFRITSIYGAVITGFYGKAELMEDDKY